MDGSFRFLHIAECVDLMLTEVCFASSRWIGPELWPLHASTICPSSLQKDLSISFAKCMIGASGLAEASYWFMHIRGCVHLLLMEVWSGLWIHLQLFHRTFLSTSFLDLLIARCDKSRISIKETPQFCPQKCGRGFASFAVAFPLALAREFLLLLFIARGVGSSIVPAEKCKLRCGEACPSLQSVQKHHFLERHHGKDVARTWHSVLQYWFVP